MESGTVRKFDTARGYGFIAPDAGGKDIFVHVSALKGSGMELVEEGDRLEYEVATDSRGRLQARTVRLLDHGAVVTRTGGRF